MMVTHGDDNEDDDDDKWTMTYMKETDEQNDLCPVCHKRQ